MKLKSLVVVGTLFVGSSSAAMASNSFTGNMDFSGQILSKNPSWIWKLNPIAVTENKAFQLKASDATLNAGGNHEWSITPKDPLFLSGSPDRAFASSSELVAVPEISFGGIALDVADKEVTIVANGNAGQKGNLVLTSGIMARYIMSERVPAAKSDYITHGAYIYHKNSTSEKIFKGSSWSNTPLTKFSWNMTSSPIIQNSTGTPTLNEVWANLRQIVDMTTTSAPGSNKPARDNEGFVDLFAGAGSLKLSFPKGDIPTSWTATLPITVKMK